MRRARSRLLVEQGVERALISGIIRVHSHASRLKACIVDASGDAGKGYAVVTFLIPDHLE